MSAPVPPVLEGVTESVKSTSARLSSLSKYLENLSTRISDIIPKNANLWFLLVIGLVVLVALSRMMSMQKSIQELQARPVVDEYLVRQVVRQQLEDTVKSLDEQNKLQLQLRHEAAMNEARRRAEEHQARLREAQAHAQAQAQAEAEAKAAAAVAAKQQQAQVQAQAQVQVQAESVKPDADTVVHVAVADVATEAAVDTAVAEAETETVAVPKTLVTDAESVGVVSKSPSASKKRKTSKTTIV
jgi:membrane protein involved in colicin uptake